MCSWRSVFCAGREKQAVDSLGLDLPPGLFEPPPALTKETATTIYKGVLEKAAAAARKKAEEAEKAQKHKEKIVVEAEKLKPSEVFAHALQQAQHRAKGKGKGRATIRRVTSRSTTWPLSQKAKQLRQRSSYGGGRRSNLPCGRLALVATSSRQPCQKTTLLGRGRQRKTVETKARAREPAARKVPKEARANARARKARDGVQLPNKELEPETVTAQHRVVGAGAAKVQAAKARARGREESEAASFKTFESNSGRLFW